MWGLINIAASRHVNYQKRYMLLRFVIRAVLHNILPHLRHNLHNEQGEAVQVDIRLTLG